MPAAPPAPINAPAPAVASGPRRKSDPPPAFGEETTVTQLDAKSIVADLRAELRGEMQAAIDAAVAPLEQKVQELAAEIEFARKDRANLTGKVSALAEAKPAAPVVTAQLVGAALPRPPKAAVIEPLITIDERKSPTMPPSGRAPTLNFDTSPYPDMPGMLDGSRRKKRVAWFVTFLLLATVGGIGLMTILSYQH
jgi:hypothetical protein